jgi:hypothetical protein
MYPLSGTGQTSDGDRTPQHFETRDHTLRTGRLPHRCIDLRRFHFRKRSG